MAQSREAAPLRDERVVTLYSPKLHSEPYVHEQQSVVLRPDGRGAPRGPGYITGFKEQVLVDSKRPDAKPLPIRRMMVHHLLYFAPGRVGQLPGSCFGLIGLRAEEHPRGHFAQPIPRSVRRRYGVENRTPSGTAPEWLLVVMVMNHYRRPKDFYVRTKVYYSKGPRRPTSPVILGDCSTTLSGMLYDVPGGGRPGATFTQSGDWTVPRGLNGRIVIAESHQHGGAKYQTLSSRTCGRRILKAPAYYGRPDHPYNTVRPILHEPGPIGNGTYATASGIPVREGDVLRRVAVHDNGNLHVAAMGFWVLWIARDDRLPGRPVAGRPARDQQAGALCASAELRSGRAAAGKAARAAHELQRRDAEHRRRLLSPRARQRRRRRAAYLEFRRDAAPFRLGRQRSGGLLVALLGPYLRHLHVHAAKGRRLPADLPRPSDADGADGRRSLRHTVPRA